MIELKRCNICESQDRKTVEEGSDCNVVKCSNCGLVYIDRIMDASSISEIYGKDYFTPWISAMQKTRMKLFQKRWNKVKNLAAKGKILDVGCGPGEFLNFAKMDGWEAYGTEISAFAAKYASENYGINVFEGVLEDTPFPDDYFDIVTIWHVLEHMIDPAATLKEVNRLIKPSGKLIIAVPNLNSSLYNLVYRLVKGRKVKLYTPGEREYHLYFYTSKTLRRLLEKTGFTVVNETIDTGQIFVAEKILDFFAAALFKVSGHNLGIAIEMHAIKTVDSR